jgi:predicted outer membrane protein
MHGRNEAGRIQHVRFKKQKHTVMKKAYIIIIALTAFSLTGFAQKKVVRSAASKASLSYADQSFVQEAINSNNEAMTLAQMALRQSKKADVQKIARQILSDHAMAQKKLYAIAHLKDSVDYNSAYTASNSSTKLPVTDNLDSRRNRTVVSIATNTAGTSSANTSAVQQNTTASAATNQQPATRSFDSTSRFGTNQTFNGNTSIDNANAVNNPNRTDIGSTSGRWTENTTVINNEPLTVAAQPVTSGITTPAVDGATTNGSVAVNSVDNTPYFPDRVRDTVRQMGSSDGFQNPGTNLSFPANYRYSRTTPNTPANNNAGSDYGVTGVPVNNAQKNALNTAPYSNNEINANIVQTGQQQGTYNPTAVINSSSTSLNNTQVAINNANANRANDIAVQARPAGTVVTNRAGRNAAATNAVGSGATVVDTTSGSAPVLVGRVANRNRGNNTSAGTPNTAANGSTNAGNAFYTNPTALTTSITTLQNVQPDAFDAQWAVQMNANQQAAAQRYQATSKTSHQPQVRGYINTVLPIIQGHQYALQQWQVKQ